jgi:hypothetical protein
MLRSLQPGSGIRTCQMCAAARRGPVVKARPSPCSRWLPTRMAALEQPPTAPLRFCASFVNKERAPNGRLSPRPDATQTPQADRLAARRADERRRRHLRQAHRARAPLLLHRPLRKSESIARRPRRSPPSTRQAPHPPAPSMACRLPPADHARHTAPPGRRSSSTSRREREAGCSAAAPAIWPTPAPPIQLPHPHTSHSTPRPGPQVPLAPAPSPPLPHPLTTYLSLPARRSLPAPPLHAQLPKPAGPPAVRESGIGGRRRRTGEARTGEAKAPPVGPWVLRCPPPRQLRPQLPPPQARTPATAAAASPAAADRRRGGEGERRELKKRRPPQPASCLGAKRLMSTAATAAVSFAVAAAVGATAMGCVSYLHLPGPEPAAPEDSPAPSPGTWPGAADDGNLSDS